MANVKVFCFQCSKEFERSVREVNRNRKKERKNFCSQKCAGQFNKKNLGEYFAQGNVKFLRADNRKDVLSPFRYFLRKARVRNNKWGKQGTDLSLEFLRDLWVKQSGKCALTKLEMSLPETTRDWEAEPPSPKRASLDRIDGKKPYQKGNVQFVCFMANLCKGSFSDQETLFFLKEIKEIEK
jgi:hypothetical protein